MNLAVVKSMIGLILSLLGFSWKASAQIPTDILQPSLEMATEIYQRFPPEKYFILNYGSSTAISSSYFRQQLPSREAQDHYFSEIMLQGLNELGKKKADAKISIFRRRSLKSVTFEVLDKTLPSMQILAGRPVIIHRTLWAGFTLAGFLEYFSQYIEERRPDIKLGFYMAAETQSSGMTPLIMSEIDSDKLSQKDVIVRANPAYHSRMKALTQRLSYSEEELFAELSKYASTKTIHFQDYCGDPKLFGRRNPSPAPLPAFKTSNCQKALLSEPGQAL